MDDTPPEPPREDDEPSEAAPSEEEATAQRDRSVLFVAACVIMAVIAACLWSVLRSDDAEVRIDRLDDSAPSAAEPEP